VAVAPVAVNRLLTVPNAITAVRLGCIPLFLWLLFSAENREAAAYLLGVLGATDWVDGYIARRFNQVSTVGKVLDPVADRLLFIVAVSAMIIDGSVPVWFAIAVLARELAVGGATVVLMALGMKRVDVTWWGKTGTFALMVAFPLFLMGASDAGWASVAQVLAWLAAIPGVVISYVAAFLYIPIFRNALAQGREARER
jgi:cardiolipin synthase (CMP-forming)